MPEQIRITVDKKGNYDPVKLFPLLKDNIRKRLPKNLAKEFYDLIQKNIESNKFNFSLSPSWVRYKRMRGWDKRPFVAEGHYKDAISIYTRDGHLAVGFKKRAMHPRSQIRLGEIAQVLEYGRMDVGMPPRPLWRNTIKEFVDGLPKKIKVLIKDDIESLL